MPSSNICWGIEIGAGAIKAIKLERSGESVNVLDFAIVPHKKVLSTPGLDQADATRIALGEFISQYDLHGVSLAISVPGHAAFARFAKLPPVEPKKVPDIVKFEAMQQIPFPIGEVEWDYQTFRDPDSPDLEVGIFAITRERIMERLAMCEDVGLVPGFVNLSPVAAYNAMAYDLAFDEKTPGTILLDVGTTSTDLIVAVPGRMWIRTFPIGGHHFTEALVSAFKLTYPKAEKLKREAEQSKHARHIFQALRPVFSDLAQDVQRSIGYYQSLNKEANLTRLIGLGSTFRLPGLRKYLKQQLQMDVYRMEQFKRLSVEGTRAGEFQAQTLTLATAYGLALQGLGLNAVNANLMPVQVIKSAMWAGKVKWFGVAAGIAVLAGGAMFIRPFLDAQAVQGNPRPRIIGEVADEATRLKDQAKDVLAGGAGADLATNMAAANMLGLANSKAVYQHLVNDLGLMFDDANK
jgi:type IV pilus assembly protein PilM